MAFHHKVQPHHHVSVWAVAVLCLVTTGTFYNNAVAEQAYGQETAQEGPSQKTKDFFGAGAKDHNAQNLEVCKKDRENREKNDSKIKERDMLVREQLSIKSKLGEQLENPTAEQLAERQALQVKYDEMQAKIEALVALVGEEDKSEAAKEGPGLECRKAVVKQQRESFNRFKGLIKTNIQPTFVNKIDPLVAKIKAQLPTLKEAGVDQAIIDQLTADLAAIEADSKILKEFFSTMTAQIDTFMAETDDDKAYLAMKKEFGGGAAHKKAGAAADDLVKRFESLEETVNKIK